MTPTAEQTLPTQAEVRLQTEQLNEGRLDLLRQMAADPKEGYSLDILARELDAYRLDAAFTKSAIGILENEIGKRLEATGATKADCGDLLICKYTGSRRYDYDLAQVNVVLDHARGMGPDHLKLAQASFTPTFKVNREPLNRLVKFGGELAKAIEKMTTAKVSAPVIELVAK